MDASVLIVESDATARRALGAALRGAGYEVHTASDGEKGLAQAERRLPDLVLADAELTAGGRSLIACVRARDNARPVLAMTSRPQVETAVRAMQEGAEDVLAKPIEPGALLPRVERALESTVLRHDVLQLHPGFPAGAGAAGGEPGVLLGHSEAMREVYRTIKRLSRSASTTVLIEGESGTGKELVARAIHATSSRRGKPFVAVNCAALSESLLESELFGYEEGAFTGAAATGKMGLFEAADGGTIFLDEIGEMGFDLQAKLLRVLQERRFLRVGGTESVGVDVRVVASTNCDLARCVREGAFRKDLFFRLKVVTIRTPPLRERSEDIVPLAKYFLHAFARQFGRRLAGFSPEALKRLRSYPWPGNVRELRNAIEGCVILETGEVVSARHLRLDAACLLRPCSRPAAAAAPGRPGGQDGEEDLSIAAVEKRHILRVLNETLWKRGEAAERLGIHRTTLTNKIREYGLDEAGARGAMAAADYGARFSEAGRA